MELIKVTIDDLELTAPKGQTILQIAQKNGINIPTLCNDERVKIYGACGLCTVEAEGMPKLLRACATKATDGMVIHTVSDRILRARKIALELLMSDHEGDCRGPCTINCPAGTDCQGYLKEIAQGKYHEAVKIIREKIPFPSSIGRICPHPCETACRRNLVDEPLSICALKAFTSDQDYASGHPYIPEPAPSSGKRVCIIGGGPSGLSAAYYLRIRGHEVTVLDAMPQMGGMLRYGIPEYRLPKAVLDKEISVFSAMGIQLKNNIRIGRDITLEQIRSEYDASVIAIGAWKSIDLRCPGKDLKGVLGGVDFLREVALGEIPDIGRNVAIVGGGNTAMDACRTAIRLGAENVYVIYRRTRAEMPAEDIEIEEAQEEGIQFKFLTNPAEIIGTDGKVTGVKLQVMELGEPDESGRRRPVPVEGKFETLAIDSVIAALGHTIDAEGFDAVAKLDKGTIDASTISFRTSEEGVFAIGEATNKGATIAVDAIGEADRAAKVIDAYLLGFDAYCRPDYLSQRHPTEEDFADVEKTKRVVMPRRSRSLTRKDFREVNLGLTEEMARAEASRCMECGCFDYKDCKLIRHANEIPIHPERLEGEKHPCFKENRLQVIARDQGKCILCGLCVRMCDEVAGEGLLGLVNRGFNTVIKPEFREKDVASICSRCGGLCADTCPTGALEYLK